MGFMISEFDFDEALDQREAATLRAVGEALEHRSLPLEQKVAVSTTEIESLRAGQMPEGW